jgi:hypothetical protein
MTKKNGKRVISNVSVGTPQGHPTAPSHTRGVKQGNAHGDGVAATARRSTSVNPRAHEPIDPRMPKLPPA